MAPIKPYLLVTTSCIFFYSSCIQKAYYQSPLLSNAFAYHAMPVASDSVKSVFYPSAACSVGGMNDRARDNVFSFQGGLHRSHAINQFRLYYGAAASIGNYGVKRYDSYYRDTYYLDTASINNNSGNKIFGTYGGYAGISATTPMGRLGEWRYIGLEGNLFNEFGNYYTFRKNLPDSAATTIDRKKYAGSLGISTELIFKSQSKNKFGMKLAFGSYLRSLRYYGGYYNTYYHSKDNLLYFSNTYHLTVRQITGYLQFNFATHASNVQFGVNVKL